MASSLRLPSSRPSSISKPSMLMGDSQSALIFCTRTSPGEAVQQAVSVGAERHGAVCRRTLRCLLLVGRASCDEFGPLRFDVSMTLHNANCMAHDATVHEASLEWQSVGGRFCLEPKRPHSA